MTYYEIKKLNGIIFNENDIKIDDTDIKDMVLKKNPENELSFTGEPLSLIDSET